MNSLNRDRWKEVDERFDKLSLKHYYPKKGSHVFEGFRANLHSELEKARAQAILSAERETVKRCIEAIEKNRKFWESVGYGQHLGGINVGFEKSIRALSLLDQEQLSNTKTE